MSDGGLIAVVIVVVLVLAALAVTLLLRTRRHHHLRERFGPEYDRTVEDAGGRREAEQELAAREKRHAELELRPLSPESRAEYTERWLVVQERFVDAPDDAVEEADTLVTVVMAERGYPIEDDRQRLADLSVEHARTLDHYRSARDVNERRSRNETSTEDLRQAMVHYRPLFEDLLGTASVADGRRPHRDAPPS